MAEDDIDNIWKDDLLGRAEDAKFLTTFLRNRSEELVQRGERKAYVLNIDADWGAGKTFFLTRLQRQLKAAGHVAIYVNAWRDDFADDPLVAVMAAIDEETASLVEKKSLAERALKTAVQAAGPVAWEVGKGLGLRLLSLAVTSAGTEGVRLALQHAADASAEPGADNEAKIDAPGDKIGDAIATSLEKALDAKARDAVAEFRSARGSIDDFRNKLGAFIEAIEQQKGIAAPFFILIDELDRCRPPYAIATLERVKHLFETPRVVFVVATDSGQLVHSIGAVYGQGFEGGRYLTRFFDRVYTFEKPSTARLVAHLLATSGIDQTKLNSPLGQDHQAFMTGFFDHTDFDVRSIERIFDILRTITTAWREKVPIELALMLPLIANFHRNGPKADEPTYEPLSIIPKLAQWKLQYWDRDQDFNPVQRTVSVADLAIALNHTAQQPLNDLPGERPDNSAQGWALEGLRDEYRLRFGGTHYSQDAPKRSVVLDYPRIIRQAGRLIEPASA
jgi:hypothetical protein